MQRDLIIFDAETYWAADYSLSKMTAIEYVYDHRFELILFSVKRNDEPTVWFSGTWQESIDFLKKYKLEDCIVAGHNMSEFDSLILGKMGFVPYRYVCTLQLARLQGLQDAAGGSLKALARHFGLKPKGDEVERTIGLRRADFTPAHLQAYGEYCVHDTDLCYELLHILMPGVPPVEFVIMDCLTKFSARPLLKLDVPLLEKYALTLADRMEEVLSELGVTRDDLTKNERMANLLRALGVDPPMKPNGKGDKLIYAFAKTDVGMQELLNSDDERVATLAAARLGAKSNIEETRTRRFLDTFAMMGAMPMPQRYHGAHCVPGDVEVLTPSGWVSLAAWSGGDIAQVEPDSRAIVFAPATKFVGPTVDLWLRVDAPYMKCDFTSGHTMPYLVTDTHAWRAQAADEFAQRALRVIPLSGQMRRDGELTADQMRVLCMVQADGSYGTDSAVGSSLAIFVKKPRKIARARELLTAAGIKFRELTFPSWPGFVRFVVSRVDFPAWLGPHRKVFGPWLLDSTDDARRAFVAELEHWDGHRQLSCVEYSSVERENAEWVATMAHLVGYSARIGERAAKGNRRKCYRVVVRARAHAEVKAPHMKWVHDPKQAFCTHTRTGFWLARHNGLVFITGNTGRGTGTMLLNMLNLSSRNREPVLKKSLLAPEGYEVAAADSSQIEARLNAWNANQDDQIELWSKEREEMLALIARKAPAEEFAALKKKYDIYRDFASESIYFIHRDAVTSEQRTIAKSAVLGAGYMMGAKRFQDYVRTQTGLRISLEEAQDVINKYRSRFSQISNFWSVGKIILQGLVHGESYVFGRNNWLRSDAAQQCIRLPSGRLLRYRGLKTIDTEKGPAFVYMRRQGRGGDRMVFVHPGLFTENLIQAIARDVVMWQLALISKRYPVVSSTYDENVYVYPIAEREEALDYGRTCMLRVPSWLEGFPINCEIGYGASYGAA